MKTATGIFPSRSAAELAMNKLRSLGIPENQLSLLTPGDKNNQHDSLPTTEGEQPGMGKVIGGVVGGALGLSGGVPLGAAIATLLFPGVGPVLAIGFITAAITGTAGVAGGAIAGGALENALTNGLPRDELYLYEDALRQGRTILMFRTEDDGELESGSKILAENGAESIDAAREKWWTGMRDAEAETYDSPGDFTRVESIYRQGFEAALDLPNRSKNYTEALNYLEKHFADICKTREFRAGYDRGHAYAQTTFDRKQAETRDATP
ncbi:MAG TPA: hypothetical protein VFK65_09650 [Candidatus Binatia bacterium]|nr:hypothetical protein [Candidatus Binatia bacterium]